MSAIRTIALFAFLGLLAALGCRRLEAKPSEQVAASTAKTTALPARLEEVDRLRLYSLMLEQQIARRTVADVEQKIHAMQSDVLVKYHLTPTDGVDIATGAITRRPAAPAEGKAKP